MEEFIQKIISINEPKTIFILCSTFIFADVLTGYLKALKFKKLNSSISRDGYIKKVGWVNDDYIVNGDSSNKKTNKQIADEVIAGKWGNRQDRTDRLAKADYDYKTIQDIVNRKLK